MKKEEKPKRIVFKGEDFSIESLRENAHRNVAELNFISGWLSSTLLPTQILDSEGKPDQAMINQYVEAGFVLSKAIWDAGQKNMLENVRESESAIDRMGQNGSKIILPTAAQMRPHVQPEDFNRLIHGGLN